MPAVEISKVLCNILFPFFSKIHNNPQLLKISFTELFRLIFTMVIPALTGIYVLAAEIIKIVYGQKWQGMLPILPVIILIAVLNTFQAVVTPLFSGIGRPKISTLVLIIQSIIMFALITPFVRIFGVVGAAWAVFAGLFISQTVLFLQLRATINLGVRGFLKILSLPFLSSGVMYLLINFTKNILAISNFLLLIGYVVYGFLIYFGALYAFDRLFGRKYYQSWLWFKKNI